METGLFEVLVPYLGAAAFGLIFFEKLAKLTPNTTDNKWVDYARKIFSILGVKVPDVNQIDGK